MPSGMLARWSRALSSIRRTRLFGSATVFLSRWIPRTIKFVYRVAPVGISIAALAISWATYKLSVRPKIADTSAITLGIGRCAAPNLDKFYLDMALVNTGDYDVTVSDYGIALSSKPATRGGYITLLKLGSASNAELPNCEITEKRLKPFLLRTGQTITHRLYATIKPIKTASRDKNGQILLYPVLEYCRLWNGFTDAASQPLGTLAFNQSDLFEIGFDAVISNPRLRVRRKQDVSCGLVIDDLIQMQVGYGLQPFGRP